MRAETTARQHLFAKFDLYHKLIRSRKYCPNVAILVDTIITTVSPT